MTQVVTPINQFSDVDGNPLESGYIYIGTQNLDPVANPIAVYWDADLTIIASQPIRTLGGYPSRSGAASVIYVSPSAYSIKVTNKNGSTLFTDLSVESPSTASGISFTPTGTISSTTVQAAIAEVDTEKLSATTLTASGGSSLVGFIQDGIGAVARTVQSKARESVSVKDFGAVGDGVTDDTAAIQAAINSTALTVNLTDGGNYKISGQPGEYGLLVSSPGKRIVGVGGSTIVYTAIAPGSPAIKVYADDVEIHNINIDNTANSTKTTQVVANVHGIYALNVSGLIVKGCDVTGGHHGIAVWNDTGLYGASERHQIVGNTLRNLQSTGVITHGVEHTLVHGNIAEDCLYDGFKSSGYSRRNRIIGNTSRSNGRDGFDLYDGFIESVLADNLAEGNTLQGYEIKGLFDGADYVIRDSVFANNVAVNNGYPGFTINSVRNCTFSGNHSTGNAQEGYYLSTVQGCTFVGNFASRNVMDGYHLAASVSRTVFNGCYAADNSWVDGITQSGTYNGFRISAGCAAQFVGCGSINGTTAGKKGGQGYGWYWAAVSTGNQSVNCYALGNTLSGFGGVVGWAAENGLININDNGTFRGAQFSSDALNQIELSTANMSVIRTGANGEYTASRASGAAIVMSAQSSVGLFGTSSNHAARLATGGTARVEVTTAGYFQPVSDNVYRLGNSSNRWSEVYVAAGTINTSDERVKEQWASISAAERRTAIKAKALLKSFKFRDAVEEKGSGARIHFGIGAQSLKAAFESEGLVAEHYAVLCYDEWPEQAEILDEDGAVIEPYRPAGNRYGVRYDELLALIIAAL